MQGRTLNRKTNTRNDLDDSAFEFGLRSLLQNDGLTKVNEDRNSNFTFSTNEQIDFGTSNNQKTLESNEPKSSTTMTNDFVTKDGFLLQGGNILPDNKKQRQTASKPSMGRQFTTPNNSRLTPGFYFQNVPGFHF